MRLNRFLALCGVASRRSAETLILEGRVRVNGETVTELATFADPEHDRVEVDGRRVRPPGAHTYFLLHKPEGVVTTADDPHQRPTVLDLVPRSPRVFPVGRLDMETSGLLLLTDDGDLAHRVLHPRYRLEKEYEAVVEGAVEPPAADRLRQGILLDDEARPTAPATVEVVELTRRRTRLRIVLHEGRKRQIRRMLDAVGHPVVQLRRIRIGPLVLGALPPGEHRVLDPTELTALRRALAGGEPRKKRRRRTRRGGTHSDQD